MVVSVCPVDTVAAPVEDVWEMLNRPARYGEWWDARVERVEPEGPATPGQHIYMTSPALGKRWDVRFVVKMVNPNRHQIQFDVTLPLGIVDHVTITCTPIDGRSCRVRYG
ncbi:MAG TPA: SRPBCC family protein [Ktedonobacteraceae bacterium]|jgi:uncharacterized protein YndB with AHSA1/START domain|nr:SRPBCC family protein [Ktedonobacteraceae bacterium]